MIPSTAATDSYWKQGAICFGISLIGMLGAANISELGTMFSDNLLSLLILSSLWIILSAMRHLLLSGWRMKLAIVIGQAFWPARPSGLNSRPPSMPSDCARHSLS